MADNVHKESPLLMSKPRSDRVNLKEALNSPCCEEALASFKSEVFREMLAAAVSGEINENRIIIERQLQGLQMQLSDKKPL